MPFEHAEGNQLSDGTQRRRRVGKLGPADAFEDAQAIVGMHHALEGGSRCLNPKP